MIPVLGAAKRILMIKASIHDFQNGCPESEIENPKTTARITEPSDALPDVSSSVGVLADDPRNIVTLIEEEYNEISQKIIVVDNANAVRDCSFLIVQNASSKLQ
ncbi:unnamed protein product [Gongylonema pulchrum]|uniref:Glycosyltransferase n=1 Tax=Gongylonema pulchrum TaxID=637853 RepID=A0A183DFC1_9BILA|nr:unnamed protein product [Gongylonema pulchrum]